MKSKRLQLLLFTDSKPLVRGLWTIIDACDLDLQITHIESLSAFQLALKSNEPDFVMCSFVHLRTALQQEHLRSPLLVICNTIDEEKEVALFVESRICDLLSFDHLFRIPFIIKREQTLKRATNHQSGHDELHHFRTLDLIKRSETRLRAIIDGFNDPILITDRFGIVRYANEAFTNLMGYHMVDILVQPIHILLDNENKSKLDDHMELLVKKPGYRALFQHQLIKGNGDLIWVGNSMNHLTDPSGHPMIIFHFRDITDQIQLNQQKEEVILYEKRSRELIEKILEGISDAFMSLDLNGRIVFLNQHASDIIGSGRNELLGENFIKLGNSIYDQLKPRVTEILFTPKDAVEEFYDDQLNQWFEARCYCRPDGVNIYLHDITDRYKRAELAKESDELFEKSFMKSPNSILIIDVETRHIVAVNNKFSQESGYTKEEVIGKTSTELGLWSEMKDAMQHLELLQANGHTKNYKFQSVNKSGEKRHAIISAEELEYQGKLHYLAVVRDVNEMVEAQENLRISEERYKIVINGANDGLWDWNILEDTAYVSPRCREQLALHLDIEEVVASKTMLSIIHPDDLESMRLAIREHFSNHTPFAAELRVKVGPGGTYRWILARGQAVYDKSGRAIRMAGSVTDIHLRRTLEDELRQKNEALQAAQQELLQAQAELELTNERFHIAIDAAEEGIWEWNILTNEEYFSPKWFEICGMPVNTNHEGNYNLWESRIHPNHLEMVQKAIQDHLEMGAPYSVEYLHLHTNGEYRWQKSTGRAIQNEKGENIRMVGSIKDITNKRRELEEIQKREQIQKAILSALPDLLFRTTGQGVILDYNASSEADLYLKPEDFLNKPVIEILPAPIGQQISDKIHQTHLTGELQLLEYHLAFGEEYTYFESRFVPVGTNEVLAVIRDVTLQKSAQEELRKEEEFTEQVISRMQHGFTMLDADGVHIRVNEAFCEMTGYSKEELLGTGLPHLYWPEEEYAAIQNAFEATIAGKAKIFELVFKKKDGTRFPISISPSQIVNKNNEMVRAFAMVKDISERKSAEEKINYKAKLLESVAMVGSLLLTNDNWDQLLERSFHIIGTTMNVDAIFYFDIHHQPEKQRKFVNHRLSWNPDPEKILRYHPDYQNSPWEFYSDFIDIIAQNLQFETHVRELPDGDFKDHLYEFSVLSVLILPIFRGTTMIGFIGFDNCKAERSWTHSEINILRIINNNIVAALDRRDYESQLQLSNERYEYVSKATFDVIWDYNIESKELFWGDNYQKLMGHETQNTKNNLTFWKENIHALDAPRVLKTFTDSIQGQDALWEDTYRFRKSNGEYCYIRDKGYILRHESGEAYRMIGAMSDMTEFVEAQNQLLASDTNLRRAQEIARLGSWNFDLVTHALNWSDEMFRIFELDKSNTTNLFDQYIARLHPDDLPLLYYHFNSGIDYQFDHRIVMPDQRIKHLTCLGFFTQNAEGQNVVLNGTAQDVTERKIVEAAILQLNNDLEQKVIERTTALEESQLRLMESQRIAGMGSWQTDLLADQMECSELLYSLLGFEGRKEPIKRVELLTHFSQEANIYRQRVIEQSIASKLPFELDVNFQKNDGQIVHLALSGRPILNEQGVATHLSGVAINITERKKFELQITEQRNTFLQVLEQSLAGYFDWLFLEDYEYMSPTLKALFGYGEDEMENKPTAWQRLIFEEDLPNKLAELQKHIDSHGAHTYEVESRFRHKNGSTVWILCKGTVIEWGPNHEAVRMIGCHIDITRQKDIETNLKKSKQALESFSYSVSHDLRAPLRGIDGWSLALQDDYGHLLDETALLYLNRVRSETQRMGKLIDEMLRLSQIGQKDLTWSPLDISKIVNKVVLQQKNLRPELVFELEISPNLSTWGDSNLLEILFTNLITNSIKFSQTESKVYLEFGMINKSNQMVYYLKDKGIGFDMGSAGKLFGVFQRLHTTSQYDGSGIGLAIVQRIVHLHQGTIWAESEVNEGTCFYFTINK